MRDELCRRQRERSAYIRAYVLFEYGGKCACCGESEPKMLAIDHINGGGKRHRNSSEVSRSIPEWIVRNGFPDGFRVLCHNCNFARGIFGGCPHDASHSLPKTRSKDSLRNYARRLDVINRYGGRCVCCGEDRYEFLAIDHVHGNGAADRKRSNGNLARLAVIQGYPDTFQILCHNCNMSKGFYGSCPHKHTTDQPHPL